ncbi:cell division protein FtsN [Pantoea sp. 1.19]|uniref:cell division protein FtsN n=1 Tax=Pantoea sp. 1.19 TaxID=1925589 RepID=UPI000948FDA9|nr:cell division protein FtsN [Pantoea sp. 1.19]
MAQKDYVSRGRSTGTRRKKSSGGRGKQRSSGGGVSKVMVGLAVAVLVTFIGGLWFIAHHKKEEAPILPNHKVTGNGLPPKPEERWRYIKELENRQPGVFTPTEPSAGGEISGKTQLTDEQRQLLEQMQADMRQSPTQLNEVPWNEQTPAQRQQTLQRQSQLEQQARMQQPDPQRVQQQEQQRRQQLQAAEQRRQQQEQQLAAEQRRRQQQEQQLAAEQRRQQQEQQQAAAQRRQQQQTTAAAPVSRVPEQESTSPPKADKNGQRWIVQCGSFKGTDQAESVRAALAFEGFESRITNGGGWNRVVIGPLNGRSAADSTLSRLRGAGHGGCILVAAGG